ncbi:MAG: ArsS family sensor histidine kinase [Thiovulaceae bacterium]|nr:ArsS family sensor histidine kinase [Sulfurimonadaceae bacterium]
MNNHSIIRLVSIFFLLIFLLINTLFWTAHQHFSKQEELDQVRRFLLAERLFHHTQDDFSIELKQLMIRPSTANAKELLSHGELLLELPFGKIVKLDKHTYFINTPPPPPPFIKEMRFMPPPPFRKAFPSIVLEDIQPSSLLTFWIILMSVDILILLFFAYLLRKLLPLHRLKNAIITFKEEDTVLNVAIHGKDEISQITYEFNNALQKIAAMREARSLFLRNILHELKTPIMKASLIADCLESSPNQERLKQIFSRMDYLLNEFAKMERFSSGEWLLNLQEYRFVDLLDQACDILLCDKNMILIEGEESGLVLHVDFELFSVALKNLLDNAFKYSDQKPTLHISTDSICICSKGEELSQKKQNFCKPFNRAYESSSAGLGLGLYITDSILKKHNFNLFYRYSNGYNCFSIKLF